MKLYSLQYAWYWCSYHVVANSREDALKIIQKDKHFISWNRDNTLRIYESYEDFLNDERSGDYEYYLEERDIGEVLVTEQS